MKIEQQLSAIQGVLRKGTKITLSEILDVVKTITGVDMLEKNTIELLYQNQGLLVRPSADSCECIRIEYYTEPGSVWDSFDEPLVQIRKVELA